MNDWSECEALEREPGRVSGAWVFRGTRVPALALFENLEDGTTVAEFVQLFPGVTIQQVRAVLVYAAKSTVSVIYVYILFDQRVPVPLRKFLPGHVVSTAYEKGWFTLKNENLLNAAEAEGLGGFLTTDKNFQYKQNLSYRSLAVVVLSMTSWPRIKQARDVVLSAVQSARAGEFIIVE